MNTSTSPGLGDQHGACAPALLHIGRNGYRFWYMPQTDGSFGGVERLRDVRMLRKPAVDFCLKAMIVVLSTALVGVIAVAIREPRVTGVGDAAPDFEVMTPRGLRMTRQNFGGAVLVLNFWASWCAPCIEEIPSLVAFQAALQGSGVVVLGISMDQDENS
jgi:thiol-disulfide isomerase/thioredoxin